MSKRQAVRVGCAGWSIPRASASAFSGQGSHLERYSRVLNCAEINSSFYRPHKPETWERWRESVPPDFRFAVKAPKAITHEAELRCDAELLSGFLAQVSLLGDKLGLVLLQIPPSLEFDARTVKQFLKLLRKQFSGQACFEPRHASWFGESANELLKEFGIARVAADPACVEQAAHPGGSPELVYFRLHGSPRRYYSEYEPSYVENLAARLAGYADEGSSTWCFFDNTASGAAAKNALELAQKLEPAS